MKKRWILVLGTVLTLGGCWAETAETPVETPEKPSSQPPNRLTEEDWKMKLTPEQFRILRRAGTERAFTSDLLNEKRKGTFHCAGCGGVLFTSEAKYSSGCGWPSFFQPADKEVITTKEDRSYGMVRTEVLCSGCDGHLGHVFKDGPKPTGLRYCINGAVLKFQPAEKE